MNETIIIIIIIIIILIIIIIITAHFCNVKLSSLLHVYKKGKKNRKGKNETDRINK